MKSIGIGIVTYNREQMFKKTLESVLNNLPKQYCHICVVNDGTPYKLEPPHQKITFIDHLTNEGVGKAKNSVFKELRNNDIIFLIEDDIIVKPGAFEKYIETMEISGLQHLMYALHGPACKTKAGKPNPRLIVNYSPNIGVALYPNCVGAFCVYTKEILTEVGLFDTNFTNACEHLSHTYEISNARGTTPWWWFADIANSWEYLDEQACSEVNSVIRPRADWQENINKGWQFFKQKHGYYPTEVPDSSEEYVVEFLKWIKPPKVN